jgi:undecaprenyl diphosphate synthase
VVAERTVPLVDITRLPGHVAIIMDGNGRGAQDRGMARPVGHREGSESVRKTVRACRRLGVRALTLYAFSEQNWHRPPLEVEALMELLREFLIDEREEMLANGIKLRMVGRRERLPLRVREVLDRIEAETADLHDMTLTLALSYGGREEIADTARALAMQAAKGELDPERIDERLIDAVLPSMETGPVDLLIRTGGEKRISNFLLWGAAYAELYFADRLWPEWTEVDLYAAIESFQTRDRRFGRVPSDAQMATMDDLAPDAASRAHA